MRAVPLDSVLDLCAGLTEAGSAHRVLPGPRNHPAFSIVLSCLAQVVPRRAWSWGRLCCQAPLVRTEETSEVSARLLSLCVTLVALPLLRSWGVGMDEKSLPVCALALAAACCPPQATRGTGVCGMEQAECFPWETAPAHSQAAAGDEGARALCSWHWDQVCTRLWVCTAAGYALWSLALRA